MQVKCFHCGRPLSITPDQLGREVVCPACKGLVHLPAADAHESPAVATTSWLGASWLSNSISGLVSLVLHCGLLLGFALVTCDYRAGGGGDGEEILIGELPGVPLSEQSDAALESEPAEAVASQSSLQDSLEVIAPTVADKGDFSAEIDLSAFSPSGAAGAAAAEVGVVSGGGGTLGSGASFMGVRSQGSRFCIIADCSGSMEGPKLDYVKQEVLETLTTMGAAARFQLIFFNSRAVPYPEAGWRHPRRDRAAVDQWLAKLSAGGGTYPTPAFRHAFGLSPPPDVIFFMTDGLFEENVVDEVAEANRATGRRVVIHTISFMDTSSEPLMRRIAADSGGRYRHVAGF